MMMTDDNNNKHLFIHDETNYSRADVVDCVRKKKTLKYF